MEKEIESIKRIRDSLVIDNQTMLKINSEYSDSLNSKTLLLDSLDEIKKLGFDLNDLKKIRYVLNKISTEDQMSPLEVKKRFFEILSRYEKNVESEKELKILKYSISELHHAIKANRSILFSQATIGITLQNLLNKGLNEVDILLVKKFIDILEENNTSRKKKFIQTFGSEFESVKIQKMTNDNEQRLITPKNGISVGINWLSK
ncbi:MAG TPA: hypothetical protein VJ767_07560 [Nitrososphaeraceae archaeon]|nr:hypothetical protein [Nitrososphaeraceae archaeon]